MMIVVVVDGVGEVGVNDDAIHITYDEQRRVLQIRSVLEQLPVGFIEVGVFAFVFPAKIAAFEHIGKALAAVLFGRADIQRRSARPWDRPRRGWDAQSSGRDR